MIDQKPSPTDQNFVPKTVGFGRFSNPRTKQPRPTEGSFSPFKSQDQFDQFADLKFYPNFIPNKNLLKQIYSLI